MTTKIYKNIAVFNPKLALDIYFVIEMDFDYDIDDSINQRNFFILFLKGSKFVSNSVPI